MNIRAISCGFILLFSSPLFARQKTDVIVMKNGDRLTCEIKALSGGVLSVKLDYVEDTIGVQWSRVARLESNQLFLVQTEGGTVYTGRLSTAEARDQRPVTIQVLSDARESDRDCPTPDNPAGSNGRQFLAAIQWLDQHRLPVFQRQSICPVQLRRPDRVSKRAMV